MSEKGLGLNLGPCGKLRGMGDCGLSEESAQIRERVPLAPLTTLGIGGAARFFAVAETPAALERAWRWAAGKGLPRMVLGEGSNVLFSDRGYPGLVIQCRIKGRIRQGVEVEVGGGENLPSLITWLNRLGLGGMECMYGIPGTLAGAVVGNAGAYGQEICQRLVEADVWSPGGRFSVPASKMKLRYRHSVFKERRDWILLRCRLRLLKSESARNLERISESILEKRLIKYPAGLKCPGSFFKNVVFEELPSAVQGAIPDDFVMHGKVPAGKLLEAVGAKGARRGDAQFADYHGNLLTNVGRASARHMLSLASQYADRVFEEFGIRLEPEILIVEEESHAPQS